MSLVIKIGGCNGSGKTSLVRAIMDGALRGFGSGWVRYGPRAESHNRPEAYFHPGLKVGRRKVEAYILGSYETTCGGMDTISNKDDRLHLINKYAIPGISERLVIFEGLITGKTYGAIGAISDQPAHKGRWIYTFMDTPFDVCVQRVLARRQARGNTNPFDPERTLRPTFRSVELTRARALREGHHVYDVDHTLPPEEAAKGLLQFAAKVGGW